jgi:signal transduction histidine kinase
LRPLLFPSYIRKKLEIFRTVTFRLAVGFAGILAGTMLVAFGLIYWQITGFELMRADQVLAGEAALLARLPPADLRDHIRFLKGEDLQMVIGAAGLFDSEHHPLAGNLTVWPRALLADENVRLITLQPFGESVRAIAKVLPDGTTLVLTRGVQDLRELRSIVLRALEICAVPAVIFSLLGGGWLSHRALRRVGVMNQAINRIMDGDLHERIPTSGDYDEMERLAGSVNRMLERIEYLVDEIRGVGDDIAHDLRTPLTRVRTQLDRSRIASQSVEALQSVIERTINDLDQCFSVITALLRIGEIENGRRRAAFGAVDLTDVAANIFDLYEPIAEEKQITLQFRPDRLALLGAAGDQYVHGDRDLLIEAVANLIDNAIKFTPQGGHVTLDVGARAGRLFLRVYDDGPGIAESEREAILGRFYRSDKSRHLPGSGLGLSLVSAIARLHDTQVLVADGHPGAVFTLHFPAFEAGRVSMRA